MRAILLFTILMSGCQSPNPVHLQNYLNYMQRQQFHREHMIQQQKIPMRPVMPAAPQLNNPYDPMRGQNPYNAMGGY